MGDQAAQEVQRSPRLTAVMARAGLDSAIQRGEIAAFVAAKIDSPLNQVLWVPIAAGEEAGEPPQVASETPKRRRTGSKQGRLRPHSKGVGILLREIFTSEFAVGVLADRVVHGGKPTGLAKELQSFLAEHGYAPNDVKTWAAEAEVALLPEVIAGWTERAAKFMENGCSPLPGSFER